MQFAVCYVTCQWRLQSPPSFAGLKYQSTRFGKLGLSHKEKNAGKHYNYVLQNSQRSSRGKSTVESHSTLLLNLSENWAVVDSDDTYGKSAMTFVTGIIVRIRCYRLGDLCSSAAWSYRPWPLFTYLFNTVTIKLSQWSKRFEAPFTPLTFYLVGRMAGKANVL